MEDQIYLIRHGETEWAREGKHTGRTDIPLTETGREQAGFLEPIFEGKTFSGIFSSPLQRAQETAKIAGLGAHLKLWDDLKEWDYGDYEGITTHEIRSKVPGWSVWTHPCPGGESIEQITERADRVVEKIAGLHGNVVLFSHGHFLRALVSRWLGLSVDCGRFFILETSTLSILSYEHETRAIKAWNGPLLTAACAVPWKVG